ncbi:hypothetical protein [Erwinia amylovora]|uniref:hypothetical protein n=1 Tax=Erwinia amylovora TaxID=552 RepID=UPI001443A9F4|nr:hypothetical protein [Erwinia amylovora]
MLTRPLTYLRHSLSGTGNSKSDPSSLSRNALFADDSGNKATMQERRCRRFVPFALCLTDSNIANYK